MIRKSPNATKGCEAEAVVRMNSILHSGLSGLGMANDGTSTYPNLYGSQHKGSTGCTSKRA